MKGRTLPIRPPRPTQPLRAQVPAGELLLTDGRTLHFQGVETITPPGAVSCTMAWWLTDDGMKVLASHDRTPHGKLLHVSVSYADHAPTWDEIKAVRYAFYPRNVDVMMLLPRDGDYINVHEYAYHLWQTPQKWGIQ